MNLARPCHEGLLLLMLVLRTFPAIAAESWETALAQMPLGPIHTLNRTNCAEVMLRALQSNTTVKALIFMPGATDEFYMFRRAHAELTNQRPTLLDAVIALTNQTLIRATFRAPLLLLHSDEDPLEPLIQIEHPATAARFEQRAFAGQWLCNDRDWAYLQPLLRKRLKADIRPWRYSYDTWHFYRHTFAAWNLNGREAIEAISLAGKTTCVIQRNRVIFDGDERVRATPRLDQFPR